MIKQDLKQKFIELYGEGDIRFFFSPGRVNLIGEHIDYNGGVVFPCALEFGTYGLVRKRNDKTVNLVSTNFPLKVSINLNDLIYDKADDWGNYPKGVMKVMMEKGYTVEGMDIMISGNIPNGAGLSSSASLELLIAVIINNLFNNKSIDRVELVKIGQECENKFVGVNCGIMDQFAIGMGKENKAILLQCDSLNYKYADLQLGDYSLVIMNTNKRRALNESKYNERRAECEKALEIIKSKKDVKDLCSLDSTEFNEIKHCISNETIRNRAMHCVQENERVKLAYKYLNMGCTEKFGRLLVESHNSLKNLYEVTGKELDVIVDEALKVPGCIGARMTGAGFGGCALAIVKKSEVDNFINLVNKNYKSVIGYDAEFYMSGISKGTHEIG
ncbi:galactokinase [Clostridium botulinum C/D]|uniref:galactokinase n=1 Tax=Clostridium botulinum TaxID=1491 RepID=UPI0002075696|nr:galactokinase [Clostridium botulinum]AEB75030.1 galactokinase [Clostridium botulinum BKT015925]KEI04224.1 galactokinase [Clostridium botulinum C/D str. Sp77]MCD3196454.1 galactokinase [Clostridium botulinum C/D]MCD3210978.1 galactokinase [Clostridium botulinum C/D]MCD3213032.1 galactokinase [Clostridium botulinum C/D]